MTQADVSGFSMNMMSPQPRRNMQERNVPLIRLEDDADLMEIYTFGRKLGQGSFGVVYEATHIETQTKWAIKEVCRPAKERAITALKLQELRFDFLSLKAGSPKVKMLDNEINILKQVNHANIIHLQEIYVTAKMTYLVTELCVGGELKQLLRQKLFFTEDETRHIIRALADAVVYLHKRDIVHRDLKLENILVKNAPDEDEKGSIDIKVADFGLSVQTGGVGIENIMTEACGTLTYMAPEMMSGRGYSQWCDVWSIGIIMYMLLCGKPPFVGKTKASLLKEMNKEVTFTETPWDTVTDGAKNLLTCLLKADPAYRMSASQILENPWITGDTNLSAMQTTMLEMMHNHLEEKEMGSTEEQSERSYGENDEPVPEMQTLGDTLEPSLVPTMVSQNTGNTCRSPAKLSPERDHSLSTPTTSTDMTKESCGRLQQDKCKNVSEMLGPLLPTSTATTQTQAGAKPSTQPSAEQCWPQDKKEPSTGQTGHLQGR